MQLNTCISITPNLPRALRKGADSSCFFCLFVCFSGQGVFTKRNFCKGEFLLEYMGTLLTHKEGVELEKEYKKNPKYGNFMYFFKHDGRSFW